MSIQYPTLAEHIDEAANAIEAAYAHDISETPFGETMDGALSRAKWAVNDAQRIAKKHQQWLDEQKVESNEAAVRR